VTSLLIRPSTDRDSEDEELEDWVLVCPETDVGARDGPEIDEEPPLLVPESTLFASLLISSARATFVWISRAATEALPPDIRPVTIA
jgi:hypothetical protein